MFLQLATLLLLTIHAKVSCAENFEDKLTRWMLNSTRYSPIFRPVRRFTDTLVLHHGMSLKMIVSVDERNQVFKTNVRLDMRWQDALLQWNPADYGGVTEINLAPEDIWTPPIILYNHAEESEESDDSNDIKQPLAVVKHTGHISWLVPTLIKSSCDINIKYFPFDEQFCNIVFGSWNYDITKLDIRPLSSKVEITRYSSNAEWQLLSAKCQRTQVSHICCKKDVARIRYSLHIRRRKLFYTMNFILPCSIIAFLLLLVFMTPHDSGERMAVGVTILLSLAVFFMMLEAIIPISEDLPLLGKYYCCIIIEGAVSLGTMSWVLKYIHHSPDPVPYWVQTYILGYMARLVWYDTDTAHKSNKIQVQEKSEEEDEVDVDFRRQNKFAMRWMKRARNKRKSTLPSAESRAIMILTEDVKAEQQNAELQEQWALVAHVLNRALTILLLASVVITLLAVFVFDVPKFNF